MTRNIIFKGRMGELFGEVHRLNVKTVQEAVHAIDTMKGGLRKYLIDCTENDIYFTVQKGEEFLDYDTLDLELHEEDIIITPVPRGALSKLMKVIVGIALIVGGFMTGNIEGAGKGLQLLSSVMINVGIQLALQGIIELTTDEPDELDEDKSQMFNGPINNTKSGIPVPLCYGEMEVGGAVVNFGFTDSRITSHQGYTFVSKGSKATTGTDGGGYVGGDEEGNVNWNYTEAE